MITAEELGAVKLVAKILLMMEDLVVFLAGTHRTPIDPFTMMLCRAPLTFLSALLAYGCALEKYDWSPVWSASGPSTRTLRIS